MRPCVRPTVSSITGCYTGPMPAWKGGAGGDLVCLGPPSWALASALWLDFEEIGGLVERNFRQLIRLCVFLAILATTLAVVAPAALATSYWGGIRTFRVSGILFSNQAAVTLFDDWSGCTARTNCEWDDSNTPGYNVFGSKARLYDGDAGGPLLATSGTVYNGSGYTASVATSKVGGYGYRSSKGITYEWDATVYTYATAAHYYHP